VEFLEWKHHIDGLERMDGFHGLERHQAKEALQPVATVRAFLTVGFPH